MTSVADPGGGPGGPGPPPLANVIFFIIGIVDRGRLYKTPSGLWGKTVTPT